MQKRPSTIKPRSDSWKDPGEGASAAGLCRNCRNSNVLQKGGVAVFVVSDEGCIAERSKRGTCSWGVVVGRGEHPRHVIFRCRITGEVREIAEARLLWNISRLGKMASSSTNIIHAKTAAKRIWYAWERSTNPRRDGTDHAKYFNLFHFQFHPFPIPARQRSRCNVARRCRNSEAAKHSNGDMPTTILQRRCLDRTVPAALIFGTALSALP
jgi:hypothetical protein